MKSVRKYLPSKKFLISLFIAMVIIAISLILTFGKGTLYESKNKSFIQNNPKFEEFKLLDTDDDGLPDWQEALYGTDPKKADTDGDGTNDEDEMKLGRDPLKPNTTSEGSEPNDKIDPQIIEKEREKEKEFESLNDTQKLARSFLSQYLATQSVDRKLTEAEINNFVSEMVNNISPEKIPNKYTQSDIKISSNTNEKDAVEKYLKIISLIITEKVAPTAMKGFDAVSSLEEENWTVDHKVINDLVKIFASSSEKIISTEVPEIFKREHLSLANNIYKMSIYIGDFNKITEDPLRSILGLQGYNEIINTIGILIDDMILKVK